METEGKRVKRKGDGTFEPGTAPGPGRPADTPEKIIQKKALKELVKEYREALGDILPDVPPVMRKLILEGNVPAIRELNDRVMDKAPQAITGSDGGALVIQFDNALIPPSKKDSE